MSKNGFLFLAGAALVAGALIFTNLSPTHGQPGEKKGPMARYNVVETQGHNLLVTDNVTSTLYFYTVEKEEKVGADLKLRASIDLTQVGRDVIKIKANK